MKSLTTILLYVLLLYSCSCIPTATEISGKFKLESVLNAKAEKIDYRDSLLFVNFTLEKVNEINRTVETYPSQGQRYVWMMADNPDQCENTARKRIFITYENGEKRRIIRDASNPMEVRLEMSEVYQGNEVPEFPVYYYVVACNSL